MTSLSTTRPVHQRHLSPHGAAADGRRVDGLERDLAITVARYRLVDDADVLDVGDQLVEVGEEEVAQIMLLVAREQDVAVARVDVAGEQQRLGVVQTRLQRVQSRLVDLARRRCTEREARACAVGSDIRVN